MWRGWKGGGDSPLFFALFFPQLPLVANLHESSVGYCGERLACRLRFEGPAQAFDAFFDF